MAKYISCLHRAEKLIFRSQCMRKAKFKKEMPFSWIFAGCNQKNMSIFYYLAKRLILEITTLRGSAGATTLTR